MIRVMKERDSVEQIVFDTTRVGRDIAGTVAQKTLDPLILQVREVLVWKVARPLVRRMHKVFR